MKKIVIINASIRKKSTYSILKRIESTLGNYNVEFLCISDYEVKPCVGCENCLRNGSCFIKDDSEKLLTKISEADGIIIGTPIYLRQISGYLKVLIDRGCAWYHRSPLVGKPILFVTSTQVTGSKQAIKYLNDLAVQWGTINTGNISRKMFDHKKKLPNKQLNLFRYYLEDEHKCNYKPSLKYILEFATQKVLAVTVLPLDYEYWKAKGYIDKPYFYNCKINIFKRIIGYIYYKILTFFITKNKTNS